MTICVVASSSGPSPYAAYGSGPDSSAPSIWPFLIGLYRSFVRGEENGEETTSRRHGRVIGACYSPGTKSRGGTPMTVFRRVSIVVFMLGVLAMPGLAWAKTEIQFWHAMTAVLGERVGEMAAKFNASQSEYEVKAVHKGSYPETLNAAIAAYRAKQPPHIVQVFEVGTQTMLSSGAVYPVYQLMKDNGIAIDWNDLIPPVKTYYSTGGNLYSMAFNSSTPILYYNKD